MYNQHCQYAQSLHINQTPGLKVWQYACAHRRLVTYRTGQSDEKRNKFLEDRYLPWSYAIAYKVLKSY